MTTATQENLLSGAKGFLKRLLAASVAAGVTIVALAIALEQATRSLVV